MLKCVLFYSRNGENIREDKNTYKIKADNDL